MHILNIYISYDKLVAMSGVNPVSFRGLEEFGQFFRWYARIFFTSSFRGFANSFITSIYPSLLRKLLISFLLCLSEFLKRPWKQQHLSRGSVCDAVFAYIIVGNQRFTASFSNDSQLVLVTGIFR